MSVFAVYLSKRRWQDCNHRLR